MRLQSGCHANVPRFCYPPTFNRSLLDFTLGCKNSSELSQSDQILIWLMDNINFFLSINSISLILVLS